MLYKKDMIVEQGYLKGVITGFKNKETVFEFLDGNRWIQAEYYKHCHDAFMPHAVIKDFGGRFYIEIEGINDKVEVRKAEA